METTPTSGYCSGCRAERRLRFAGWASDGRENSVRPRAFYRSCVSCSTRMLVLADATDALGLVRVAVQNWLDATGYEEHAAASPALRVIDLGDMEGELLIELWRLYSAWDPSYGDGRVTFRNYASGLLPRRIASYVRDAVGSDSLYRRNGRGNLTKVWPKAHATSVCVSLDGAAAAEGADDDGAGHGEGQLARAVGAGAVDVARDRSPDLGRILVPRGR